MTTVMDIAHDTVMDILDAHRLFSVDGELPFELPPGYELLICTCVSYLVTCIDV